VGTDVVVVAPPAWIVHRLSGGASAAWEALDVPLTFEDLVDHLATAHGVDASGIADEMDTCVQTLVDLGVVEPVGDGHD
jgi:Coenzyme PQQ synthesis protein D (PqqD)